MPNEAYDPNLADTRTFGHQVNRIVSELHRPDLLGAAQSFARDSIRHWSKNPFFFTEVENTDITVWQANLFCPYGYTIRDTADDGKFYIFVNLVSGNNGSSKPTFNHNLFVPAGTGPIFSVGQTGTTADNAVTWATVQAWPNTLGPAELLWTQLSTIPKVNQIIPPIDYLGPKIVEITTASLRYELDKVSYRELRGQDVIRPAPVTTYPTQYAYFNNRIYVWPYPVSFYPITLSYNSAPFPPMGVTQSNFWTTTAEALVRTYAKGLLNEQIIRDQEDANADFGASQREFMDLQTQEYEIHGQGGIPASPWP